MNQMHQHHYWSATKSLYRWC